MKTNSETLQSKTKALIEYLKELPHDHWATQEEIIAALPDHFKSRANKGGTTLDRSIHQCMQVTQKGDCDDLIINNRKRAYKLATLAEAKAYTEKQDKILFTQLKRNWIIKKALLGEGNFNLFLNDYAQRFIHETSNEQR